MVLAFRVEVPYIVAIFGSSVDQLWRTKPDELWQELPECYIQFVSYDLAVDFFIR